MQTQWPKRGDILMGRPLFHGQKSNTPLSEKEHPCVVLKVVERKDLPGSPIMAITLPMTHAKISGIQPNNIDIKPYHVKNLKMDPKNKSVLCTDSPNVIVLNSEDNGLRKAGFAPDWVSPYTHGRVVDEALLSAAEALTKSFLTETNYDVPKQGHAPGERVSQKKKAAGFATYEQRRAAVLVAAKAKAAEGNKAFLRLQSALRAIDINGENIPGSETVPGFQRKGVVMKKSSDTSLPPKEPAHIRSMERER